jgi:hypothetical protein
MTKEAVRNAFQRIRTDYVEVGCLSHPDCA